MKNNERLEKQKKLLELTSKLDRDELITALIEFFPAERLDAIIDEIFELYGIEIDAKDLKEIKRDIKKS